MKDFIVAELEKICKQSGLEAAVKVRNKVSNLEAIELTLGRTRSGLSHRVNEDIERVMIKYNGALIYQQLFNGKIIALIHYPYIEGYLDPRAPRTLAIFAPDELKEGHFVEHFREFMKEIIAWEDFEQDEPQNQIGFRLNYDQDSDNFE